MIFRYSCHMRVCRHPSSGLKKVAEGRTLFTGSLLLATVYTVELVLAIAVALWFQGCDPNLSGAIKSRDQILPFYIKTYLKEFPGFTGLFLSAVVSAATSTISSVINSLAAVIYVDVLTPRVQNIDSHLLWITRALALLLGGTMIAYSCLCVYMGSITKVSACVFCISRKRRRKAVVNHSFSIC
ncbi:hypothetical protein V5799_008381 [Amblyomma americanum]|uniref:Sodium/solute symporter n=1 Tax=Amblyomma americanum TaxID=6943 RepID=A0AAQ4FDC6_AMBAM